jgi:hypothetical protein
LIFAPIIHISTFTPIKIYQKYQKKSTLIVIFFTNLFGGEILLDLNIDLKNKFEEAAKAMQLRLKQKSSTGVLRRMIFEKGIGSFNQCQRSNYHELSQIVEKGGIVGVDGSTNSAGGPFPYLLTLQQALAKACNEEKGHTTITDAFSPLTMKDPVSQEEYRDFVKRNLACLEVKAALAALEQLSPRVLLLDGSLVRYKIEADPLWEKLKSRAIAKNTILVGVVEGISTSVISECLKDRLPKSGYPVSDWEILFGLLQVGEMLEIAPGLFKEGFRTCFIRASVDPKPIGIDLPEEQQGYLNEVANLVFTLTPRDGRGIPLWIDIIDKSVRISDAVMEGLLGIYLGDEYVEYLKPKRQKREM